VATAAGQFVHRSFTAAPDAQGELVLRFSNGGGDPYWTVNAVEVRPAVTSFDVSRVGGSVPQPADGQTVDVFQVTGAAPGAWYTLSTNLGAITTADQHPNYAGVQIQAPDSDFTFSLVRPPIAGTADVRVEEVNGASRGEVQQEYEFAPVWRFDFNTASSATATGLTGVGASNTYNPGLGYGWQTNASTFARGAIASPLLTDGHWGTSNTFLVDVANGDYLVNVTLGDGSFARNNISVWAEGNPVLSGLASPAGQFIHRSFPVTVSDGQLSVQIASTGGDPYFTINALEVYAAAQGTHFLNTADGGQAFTGTGATPNSLVTVRTTLGTISGVDQDNLYQGVQVLADGSGQFSFSVTPPAGGGVATITTEEVAGLGARTMDYNYAVPAVRRFDFNGPANDTELFTTPVYTGVRGNQWYSAANGYGWTQAVSEFQRATTSKLSDSLYRDGHWGSAARTFQLTVIENTTYNIRVYVGDANFARNNIQISVEGNAWEDVASTAANTFAHLLTSGTSTDSDGLLTIAIRNNGGDPYWVINGLDIWESTATDPGESPLLAATWGMELVGSWLSQEALHAALPIAREYWISTGLTDVQLGELYRTPVSIGDLSHRGALGVARPEGIWLDASGAGLGWSVGSGQWSVGSGQLFGVGSHQRTTANGQLPAHAYDLLTVLTHELGHVLGYHDLDSLHHSDHIMAGVLQPGVSRIAPPYHHVAADLRDAVSPSLKPFESSAVDRVLDDLLADAPRGTGDGWGDRDDEFERMLGDPSDESHEELDQFFAHL
jgi:hypothetical protein